ncbi:DUF1993 domain-containing protein [Niveispirillum cyanobacteriorum]|uniref:DUF1993 domain-containing protein n=1 Tax=Niveispirillum cyanobacteriorum TaxID=1612173 RepID=A0A2K9N9U7_9PROT|nr:DUF1993 domain-containing protein [Niveispirillum cyanobacteriorum]AUN29864.1 DUF1993 domain-containing protein [Niveispirillum cyanobacteriorum]GGE60123.1 hypothetical protein GCM10011317_17320 [Niveispirillum cyanobacteriorum]
MSLHELLVPTFTQMLRAMGGWLDKAQAHQGADTDALLSNRLAPDMYPLAAQIRFACFQAQEPFYRLQDVALPDTLLAIRQQGWNANANPGSWVQARECLSAAIGFLTALEPSALDRHDRRTIGLALPNGMVFDMSPEQYARDWCLPQFYFHLTTVYTILRHHGIPLGKADYVAHMLAYLRPPGATPA